MYDGWICLTLLFLSNLSISQTDSNFFLNNDDDLFTVNGGETLPLDKNIDNSFSVAENPSDPTLATSSFLDDNVFNDLLTDNPNDFLAHDDSIAINDDSTIAINDCLSSSSSSLLPSRLRSRANSCSSPDSQIQNGVTIKDFATERMERYWCSESQVPQFGNVPVCDEYERSIAPSERLLEAIKAPVGPLIES